jgi:ferredoxin
MLTIYQNVHSVELFSKSNCQGTRQNQINTAGCYESSISIGSFRVVTVAHDKRGLFDGAQKESKTLTTSTFPSQNKASVTPAEECFDKETGAYILDCDTGISKVVVGDLVKRDVDDAEKGVRRCPPMTGKYHNCTLYPVAVADKMPGLKLGKCWVDTSTTSPESDILEIVCPHLDKRSDSIDDREVISRQDADDAEKGIDRCPPMKGEYKGCSIYPVVGDFQFPGRNLGKCWLPVSPTYPERAVFEIVCPNTNNRSVSIDDRVVPFRRDADDAEQGIDRCPPMTGEFKSCALYLVGASGPPGIYLFQCWLPLSPTDPEGFLGQLVCPIIGTRSVSINGPVVPSCPAHVPKDCTLTPGPKNITHGPDLGVAHYNRTQLCETHPHPGAPKFWWLKCPWNFGTCGEDEDLVCPSIKESSSVDEDIGTSKDIAARNASPQKW